MGLSLWACECDKWEEKREEEVWELNSLGGSVLSGPGKVYGRVLTERLEVTCFLSVL